MIRKILVVGSVAGGASATARLRRLDERTEIILLERGEVMVLLRWSHRLKR